MARAFAVGVGNWWSHSKTVILIWCICIFFYILFFHMALQNSSSSSSSGYILSYFNLVFLVGEK